MGYWAELRAARRAEWHAAGGSVMSAGWTAQIMWIVCVFGLDTMRGGPVINTVVHGMLALGTFAMLAGSIRYTRYYGLRPAWAIAGLFSILGATVLLVAARSHETEDVRRGFDVKQAVDRSPIWRMVITVRLKGAFADHAGGQDITMEMPKGASVSTAVRMIGRVMPEISDHLQTARFFVKDERLKLKHELNPKDVLTIEPGGDIAENL